MATDYTLSEQAAEEIRAMLARRRMSGRRLAEQLGVSHTWVSYRLTGAQEIGLNDLQRIAEALDVTVASLLPGERHRADSEHNARRVNSGPSLSLLAANDRTGAAVGRTTMADKHRNSRGPNSQSGERSTTRNVRRAVILAAPTADSVW